VSFSFNGVGTVEQARAQIKAANVGADNEQAEKVREFILGELDQWPASTNPDQTIGVYVESSGHCDKYTRSVSLSMRPIWFPNVEG
jgi:hypothetical protein